MWVDAQNRQLLFEVLGSCRLQYAKRLFVWTDGIQRHYQKWQGVAGQLTRTRTWKYTVVVAGYREIAYLKVFLSIHGISGISICTARGEHQLREVPTLPTDGRGNDNTLHRKISNERCQHVRDHISSFPRYTSHYSRRDSPNRWYLQGVSS